MTTPSAKPIYVSLHRLGQLSGKARGTLLLRMRDGELVADALLDLVAGCIRCLPLHGQRS